MTVQRFFYYSVMCAFILLSCSSEKGDEIQTSRGEETGADSTVEQAARLHDVAADYSITIEPQDGFRSTAFRLSSKNFELSNAVIQWMANGVPVKGAEDILFTPQDAGQVKGDTIQAKVIIDNKEVLSNIVKIKNAPPEFTKIKIMPEVFKPGDTLFVEALANDIDGDEVTISYKWLKNREPAGDSMRSDSPLKRGDSISITVTPFDGEEYGSRVVLDKKIENLPPMIVEDMEFNFDGKIYTHRVRADDPDEDPLTYSLKSSGDNMTINSETGLITWSVPKDFAGDVPVTVSVADGHGGESTRELTFRINPAAVKGKDSSKEFQQK
jgi:hypothetical protein